MKQATAYGDIFGNLQHTYVYANACTAARSRQTPQGNPRLVASEPPSLLPSPNSLEFHVTVVTVRVLLGFSLGATYKIRSALGGMWPRKPLIRVSLGPARWVWVCVPLPIGVIAICTGFCQPASNIAESLASFPHLVMSRVACSPTLMSNTASSQPGGGISVFCGRGISDDCARLG